MSDYEKADQLLKKLYYWIVFLGRWSDEYIEMVEALYRAARCCISAACYDNAYQLAVMLNNELFRGREGGGFDDMLESLQYNWDLWADQFKERPTVGNPSEEWANLPDLVYIDGYSISHP